MHRPINFKSSYNTSKWQMVFNSAFVGLNNLCASCWDLHNRTLLGTLTFVLVLIPFRGWVDHKAIMRPEGLSNEKLS